MNFLRKEIPKFREFFYGIFRKEKFKKITQLQTFLEQCTAFNSYRGCSKIQPEKK